jgi:hypothetical protein
MKHAAIRYLRRLTKACPQTLWNLLFADAENDGSWLKACSKDFDWFRLHYDVPFAPATNALQDWMLVITTDCLQYYAAKAEMHVFQLLL